MDKVASSALIGGIISYLIPIEDNSVKIQLGLVGSQLFNVLLEKTNFNFFNYFRGNNNQLIISDKYEEALNPIFYQVEEYFIKKYISEIKNLQLVPKNGEISFSSYKQDFRKELKDMYHNHEIILKVNSENFNENEKKTSKNSNILLTSKTASLDIIKKYVEYICDTAKPDTSIIKIFKVRVQKTEKFSNVNWDTIYIKTNKSYKNTIVNENIKIDLYDDIQNFLDNEEWFTNKGIPYKRGYLLHGPPGTGKTSIIKAVANTHQLPIFNLDLSSVRNNADLLKLVTDINYLSNNKKYIVTIEDIDRCPLFSNSYDRFRQLEKNTLSIDCLLNVLDGIMETHGRLFFMSANDTSPFDKIKDVLFRPGRIDKQLNISYCSKPQISKIIANFYDIKEETLNDKMSNINIENITPATLIKYLQDNKNIDDLYEKFFNKKNIKTDENLNDNFEPVASKQIRVNTKTVEGNQLKKIKIKKNISEFEKKRKKEIKIMERNEKWVLSKKKQIQDIENKIKNEKNEIEKCDLKIQELKNKKKNKP